MAAAAVHQACLPRKVKVCHMQPHQLRKDILLAVITPLVTGKEQNTIAIVCQVAVLGTKLQMLRFMLIG